MMNEILIAVLPATVGMALTAVYMASRAPRRPANFPHLWPGQNPPP